MAAAGPTCVDVQQTPIISASRPTTKLALYHLFRGIEEEEEGSIYVATQRDESVFPDIENLVHDRERFKEHLFKNLKLNLRAEASVAEFCEHIWGLDTEKIAIILSQDWIVNQSMLSRYNRQSQGSSTRRRPFRAIWSNLQADVLGHFGMSYRDTQDEFWDKEESCHLENIFAEGAPDLLRIWKSAVQVGDGADVVPDWEDVKAVVVFSQVKSTSTYLDDAEEFMPPAPEFPIFTTSGLYLHDDAPIGENLSASLKRHRAHNYAQCSSTPKKARSNNGITEDELRLATYAVECLANYTRRYATGILVDGTRISLYYIDRNLSIRTTPFDFSTQEGAQYLALIIFALTQCDNIHTGFDPCIRLLQLSEDARFHKLVSNDHDVTNFDAECFVFPQPPNGHPVFYLVEDHIHQFSGLFGHGMSTFTVQEGTLGLPIVAPKQILKVIWRGKTCPSDAEIVDKLTSNVPELEDFLPITEDIGKWNVRALSFPWVKMSLPGPNDSEEMVLQVSLTQPDVHLWEVETLDNFKKVFKDCLIAHHLAWSKGGILHGSISEQSLGAYKQPEGSADAYKGIIKHWELGTQHPHSPPVEIPNRKYQGTRPFDASVFMAIDLAEDAAHLHHSGSVRSQHFYRHDLESFFYILVWACVHYSIADGHQDAAHPHEMIQGWLSLGRGAECKQELLQDAIFFMLLVTDLVKSEWTRLAHNWVLPLRNMFANAMQSIPDEGSPEYERYDFETCDRRITFENFMEIISNPVPFDSSF